MPSASDRISHNMKSPKSTAEPAPPQGIVFWMQAASDEEGATEARFLERFIATDGINGLHVRHADDTEALEKLAGENGEDRILMLVQSPVQELVRAMERGKAPGEALHRWLASAQAARTVLRRHRRRAVVADAARFAEDPAEVLNALGLPADAAAAGRAPPTKPDDPVLELIAAEVVREVPGIRALVGELDASAPVRIGRAHV